MTRVHKRWFGSGITPATNPPEVAAITTETIGIKYSAVISANSPLRLVIL